MADSMKTTKNNTTQSQKTLKGRCLFSTVYESFGNIIDHRTNSNIPLKNALMSAFAIFSLKDPEIHHESSF